MTLYRTRRAPPSVRRRSVRRITDRTFWRAITFLGVVALAALYFSYRYFFG